MKNRIIGVIIAALVGLGLLAGTPSTATAGTPGVFDGSGVSAVSPTFTGSGDLSGASITIPNCSNSTGWQKKLKLYIRNTDTGEYVTDDGEPIRLQSAYNEWVSLPARTSNLANWSMATSLQWSGGPSTSCVVTFGFRVNPATNTLPSGNYRVNAKAVDEDGDIQAAWVGSNFTL